jgi:cytochrome P450
MMSVNGSIVDQLDPAKIVDLDLFGEEMRQGALNGMCADWARRPPFYVVNSGIPQVVVGRYADAQSVYQDGEHISMVPPKIPGYERFDPFNGVTVVIQTDGEEHTRIRSVMNPCFSSVALAQVAESIKAIVAAMLDEVEALGGPFDCMNDFAIHLMERILLDGLLGLTADQQDACLRMYHTFPLVDELAPGEEWPAEYVEAQREALQVMSDVIEDRRARPREHDFVTTLIAGRHNGEGLREIELVANTFAILGGGLGTTGAGTAAMLMNLCKHRDQFDEVIADPGLIAQTIDESLRYQSPQIFGFPRFATDDFEIGGTPVFKDMPVHVSAQAADLDPDAFPDPLVYDIHRAPKNLLAFGQGAHHCLGIRFARKVMTAVLEQVCERFPDLHLQDPDFEPYYKGAYGELIPATMPMHTGK